MNAPRLDQTNPFLKSDIEDAARTRRWLRLVKANPNRSPGEGMEGEPRWIKKRKNIPCAWYAAEVLAPANGITAGHREVFLSRDRRWCAYVIGRKGSGPLARAQIGASVWGDRQIALCFAFRNSIKQLLPMQPNTSEKLAYRDSQKNALRKYA